MTNTINLPWADDVPSEVKLLANQLLEDLLANGVRVRVENNERISYGEGSSLMCSGYFVDSPAPELGLAIGKPWQQWAPILLHECCHGAQWKESSLLWQNLTQNGRDIVNEFDDWLEGRDESSPERLRKIVSDIQAAEFDCEERVVELIKKHQLPIDVDSYIQRANAYVWFYEYALENRSWYPSQGAPYENENIWSKAPETWTPELPEPLRQAYQQAYAPPRKPKGP